MRDWTGFVREHLPSNILKPEREEEIIEELGQQLSESTKPDSELSVVRPARPPTT
ncbi:MAG: hypothetical protein ACE15E_14095 [Acidobacteriota bacterium]